MANTQETIVDIIAAMRDEGHTGESSCLEWVGTKMRYYADRLEAAWKREKATAEKSSVVGDCAKLREAAVSVYNVLEKLRPFSLHLGDVGRMREFSHLICLAKNRLDAALAAPPRNCDVGTEQEKARRFLKYCVKQDCERACPFRDCKNSHECAFAWAQMPYKEGASS